MDNNIDTIDVIFELNEKESSNINSIRWCRNIPTSECSNNTFGTLIIEFKIKNIIYEYYDVPFCILNELINAKSFGKYVIGNIVNKYTYKKVTK